MSYSIFKTPTTSPRGAVGWGAARPPPPRPGTEDQETCVFEPYAESRGVALILASRIGFQFWIPELASNTGIADIQRGFRF